MSTLYFDAGPFGAPKVMLATTSYDAPDASYTFSIANSREAMHNVGIQTSYLLLVGNCHVDDARNGVVRDFLASDCQELVFLDADVSWSPETLVQLCQFDDVDVVGGVYPYRRQTGKEGMPVRNMEGKWKPDEDGLLEVAGLPTGFLRIKRHVLERLSGDADAFYKSGDADPVPVIFERRLDGDRRMSGDINFCTKWSAAGGRLYAATELRLGHCGKQVIKDSLAASLRRQTGQTMRYVADAIKEEAETAEMFAEAVKAANNPWGAEADFLSNAVIMARKARGPIIEAGSGLTTVLMAAATDQTVWCLEHSQHYAEVLEGLAHAAGVKNIAIVHVPIKDGWYDLSEDMDEIPRKFACGLVDGPPRLVGDRMKFFDTFDVSVIMCDDADEPGYLRKLEGWAAENGKQVQPDHRSALITDAPRELLKVV